MKVFLIILAFLAGFVFAKITSKFEPIKITASAPFAINKTLTADQVRRLSIDKSAVFIISDDGKIEVK